jgi:hypothetical protein
MAHFDPRSYGSNVAELVRDRRLMALGPGQPNSSAQDKLKALDAAALVGSTQVKDQEMAKACLAGLWLYHGYLDESHSISQSIHTTTGSYWHGIMHRREPDASNAAYWFRRVGDHPVFAALASEAKALGYPGKVDGWNPFQFIDMCEQYRDSGAPEEEAVRRVQLREWELLFDWCWRQAVSGG